MTTIDFGNSIHKASKSLKPFAIRLTRDIDEANDLLQDTLLKAILNKEKFSVGTNLKAWLYTIMKNTFLTNYQKLIKKKTFIDTTDNLHFINSKESSTYNLALSAFASNDIDLALDKLDSSYRVPFIMYFRGFKYNEISEKLNIPIGTVKNRIHLARHELKTRLYMYKSLSVN